MRLFLTALLTSVTLASCGVSPNQASDLDSSTGSQNCPGNVQWRNPQISALNSGLRNYAASHQGQEVGNGECAELPDVALRALHAKTFYQLGPTGADADYVWGNRVTVLSTVNRNAAAVEPGDVIQYRNFTQKEILPGGAWWTSSAPHHTSVVKAVSVDGRQLCVYEQNVSGRRTVGTGYVDLNAIQSGTLSVYRPRF